MCAFSPEGAKMGKWSYALHAYIVALMAIRLISQLRRDSTFIILNCRFHKGPNQQLEDTSNHPSLSVASGVNLTERIGLVCEDELCTSCSFWSQISRTSWADRRGQLRTWEKAQQLNILKPAGSSALLLVEGTLAYQVHAACSNSKLIKLLTNQFAAAGVVWPRQP